MHLNVMARFPQSLVLVMIALLGFLTPSHGIRTSPLRHEINAVAGIKPTLAGYLPVGTDASAIYYAYYESHTRSDDEGEAPIILWLQVNRQLRSSSVDTRRALPPFDLQHPRPPLSLLPSPN